MTTAEEAARAALLRQTKVHGKNPICPVEAARRFAYVQKVKHYSAPENRVTRDSCAVPMAAAMPSTKKGARRERLRANRAMRKGAAQ